MKQFSGILFCIAVLLAKSFAQHMPDTIPVVMKNDSKHDVFLDLVAVTGLEDSRIQLTNLPEHISSFRIMKLTIDSGMQDLHIFYGVNQLGKRIVIFDSDFNGDLKHEINYAFDADVTYRRDAIRSVIDSIPSVEIKYPGVPSIFLKPSVFNCCIRYTNAEDSAWHLELQTSYYRSGQFKRAGRVYSVALSGYTAPVFKGYPDFYLDTGKSVSPKKSSKEPPYRLHQTVFADRREFVINSVSRYGDSVWIIDKGVVDSAFGGRVGLFARNIHTATLQKQSFDLASLRGSYVLLDFWGTWCGPCIELIPDLVKLNNKYRQRLKLVSIAYDKRENLAKLKKMVKSKNMDWVHLFTDEDSLDNISYNYDVSCYPTSILIDPRGKIVYRGCGQQEFNELLEAIENHVGSKRNQFPPNPDN